MKWIKFKVWCVRWLRRFNFIPRVWYQCELDLAKMEAERLFKLLNEEKK